MVDPNIYNALNEWAVQVVQLARNNLKNAGKVATGVLYDSISFKITQDGDVQFYYEDYGDNVEAGRKPGSRMPPVQKIIAWAKIKGLPQFRDKETGRYLSHEQRGWMIAKAVARDGFRPIRFFSEAFDLAINQYPVEKIEDIIEKNIEKSMDGL